MNRKSRFLVCRWSILIAVLAIYCRLFTAGAFAAAEYKIYGTVTSSAGSVLSEVEVSLLDTIFKTKTDETGAYFLRFVPVELPHKYTIQFKRNGYKTVYRAFVLKAASARVIPLNLSLAAVSVNSGSSANSSFHNGESFNNVSLSVSGTGKQKPSSTTGSKKPPAATASSKTSVSDTKPKIRTKRELRYIMGQPRYVDVPMTPEEIAAEDARLRAIAEAQKPKPVKPAVVSGPPVKFVITGRVVNNRGRSLAGAEVFLGKSQEAYAKTDRKGKFTLEFIVPLVSVKMSRTLIIQHQKYNTRRLTVRFNPKREEGIALDNIRMEKYSGLLKRW